MESVLFVYGSVGGNTRMVVEAVEAFLSERGFRTSVREAELIGPSELLKFDVVVLASPTYGHGSLEYTMAHFVGAMKGLRLDGKPCAVIGLGDPRYEAQYHLESAPILEKALTGAGGKLLLPALRISGAPVMHLKGLIPNWAEQLSKKLDEF